MPVIDRIIEGQEGLSVRSSINNMVDFFNQTGLTLDELTNSSLSGEGENSIWRTREGDILAEVASTSAVFDIEIIATGVKLIRIDKRTTAAALFWAEHPDGTRVELEGLVYEVASGSNDIADMPGLIPLGIPNTQHFGDTGNSLVDNSLAWEQCRDYAGVGGSWKVRPTVKGDWTRLGNSYDAVFSFNVENQSIDCSGVILSSSVEMAAIGVSLTGVLTIDGSKRTDSRPWFGLIVANANFSNKADVYVKNCGVDFIMGGVKGVNVSGGSFNVTSVGCAITCQMQVDQNPAAPSGAIAHVPSGRTRYIADTFVAGSGYTDGQWFTIPTGGTGVGLVLGVVVSSGAIVATKIIAPGRGYSVDDVLTITPSDMFNRAGSTMVGGSGASYTVRETYSSDPSAPVASIGSLNLTIDCTTTFFGGMYVSGLVSGRVLGRLVNLSTINKPYLQGRCSGTQFTMLIATGLAVASSPSGKLIDLTGSVNAFFINSIIRDLQKTVAPDSSALTKLALLGTAGKSVATTWEVSDNLLAGQDVFGDLQVNNLTFPNGDTLVDLTSDISTDPDFSNDPNSLVTRAVIANYVRDLNPAGFYWFFAANNIPTGWLECDGSVVSRTTYADLFAAIGTLYGAGDGNTTFQIPDIRGEFLRALDRGKGIDIGRVLGSKQQDAVGRHFHGHIHVANLGPFGFLSSAQGISTGFASSVSGGAFPLPLTSPPAAAANVANENRPYNTSAVLCIRY